MPEKVKRHWIISFRVSRAELATIKRAKGAAATLNEFARAAVVGAAEKLIKETEHGEA